MKWIAKNTALVAGVLTASMLAGCVDVMGLGTIPAPLVVLAGIFPDRRTPEERSMEERRDKARKYADHYELRQRHAERVTAALMRYGREATGRAPEHAAALVAAGVLKPEDFVAVGSKTRPEEITVGHTTLAALPGLPASERWAAVREAADALPDDVVAHRLGDLVFVYHGVRPALAACSEACDLPVSKIWRVVVLPDPDFNGLPDRLDFIWLGAGDVEAIYYHDLHMKDHLEMQNFYRGKLGLAPLPDPATVRSGEPATAPPGSSQTRYTRQDETGW